MVEDAQYESHCPWFFTGATASSVVQSTASKVLCRRTHAFANASGHSTHCWAHIVVLKPSVPGQTSKSPTMMAESLFDPSTLLPPANAAREMTFVLSPNTCQAQAPLVTRPKTTQSRRDLSPQSVVVVHTSNSFSCCVEVWNWLRVRSQDY